MEKTFRLRTSVLNVGIRSFTPADSSLLGPSASNPLLFGEWLTINSDYEAARPSASPAPDTIPGPYVLFTDQGRSDTQAIYGGRIPLIIIGSFLADTKIFTGTPSVGAKLEVANITYSGATKSGLQAATTGRVIGYVMKTAASNNGYLQFLYTAS